MELSVFHNTLSTLLNRHGAHLLHVCSWLMPSTVCGRIFCPLFPKCVGLNALSACTLFIHSPLPSVTFHVTVPLELRDGINVPPAKKKGERRRAHMCNLKKTFWRFLHTGWKVRSSWELLLLFLPWQPSMF